MNYADIKRMDVSNGTGIRVSLFVSGCPHHCKNCFNEETWDFNYGKPFTEKEEDYIINELNTNSDIYDGLTILGGEPLAPENIGTVYEFLKKVRNKIPKDMTIWIYTGYTVEALEKRGDCAEVFKLINYLVDGPFIEKEKDLRLKYRGSRNQRIWKTSPFDMNDDEDLKGELYSLMRL